MLNMMINIEPNYKHRCLIFEYGGIKMKSMLIMALCIMLLCACGNGSSQEKSALSDTNQTSIDRASKIIRRKRFQSRYK